MTIKAVKDEARRKLALNMHQAIVIYAVEFTIFITLIALIVISGVSFGVNMLASIVIICYGVLLVLIAVVGAGMVNFAMTDFYLVTYRCKPYNIRRLGETLARSNITKVLLLSLKRTLMAVLLLLCAVIPGVIYLVRTSMAHYLLIANPKMKASAALSASNKVMSGKTGAYFQLVVSLLGWYVLGVLTLGLGFIFIKPYMNLIKSVYYKRNIQGDKTVYAYQPQPAPVQQYPTTGSGATPVQTVQVQNQSRTDQTFGSGEPIAPIDTLADDDVMDMNAAMRDLSGVNDAQSDIPEVPIAPVPSGKTKEHKQKKTRESKLGPDVLEHKIDGTGIVEKERTLSTQEINESDLARQQAIENMYTNSKSHSRSAVNYFESSGNQSPDDFGGFADDFGAAEPVRQDDIIVEPVVHSGQAQGHSAEQPVMSDSEFDEFLRNFDSGVQQQQEPLVAEQPQQAHIAENENKHDAALRLRREAEERIERDRRAASERIAAARQQQQTPNANPQYLDRAERIRREREQRLNLNKK